MVTLASTSYSTMLISCMVQNEQSLVAVDGKGFKNMYITHKKVPVWHCILFCKNAYVCSVSVQWMIACHFRIVHNTYILNASNDKV